jgi:hypothetical protein
MRSSAAIGLLLVSSASIFGLYHRHHRNSSLAPGPEPVWVNGVMGVYNPDTHVFVPATSPLFDQTCDLIQQRRDQAGGGNYYYSSGYSHHWTYYPSLHYFSYPSGGASGSGFWGSSSSSSYGGSHNGSDRGGSERGGSERGGFGAAGHSAGGHGGGE